VLPTRAAPIELDRSWTIAETAAKIIASGHAHLQANVQGVLSGADPEHLHQMRVAVRRLRSCLSAYADVVAPEPLGTLRAELRWLGRRLGPARDWDVFLTELLPSLEAGLNDADGAAALKREAQALRDSAARSACAAVQSRRYDRLVRALVLIGANTVQTWDGGAGEPVLPFATRLLERRLQRVLARGSGIKAKSIEELHALRIAVKKLRYAVEFFESLYPGAKTKRFRSELVKLQDSLGAINDAGMVPSYVDQVVAPASRLREHVRDWSGRRIASERERLRDLWRVFRRRRAFWS